MKLPVVALSPRESGVGSDSDASLSLLILLPGMILFVWGWEYLKPLALPLAYLQFMIPWMDEFINRLHWF
ncbi:MAG: archaeosortase/exosortase family protein, partial [Deltaproteobacteria bacterium]|nr:archaeosortase/exosortase family protein [Deltaproteobacteria bacterium]